MATKDVRREGVRIRTYRQNGDLSQQQLARKAGISQPSVSRVEQGKGNAKHVEACERAIGIKKK